VTRGHQKVLDVVKWLKLPEIVEFADDRLYGPGRGNFLSSRRSVTLDF
jgi:hypothetical protein